MSDTTNTSPASGFTLWVRYALIAFAILLVAGGVVQFFLAGLSVFDAEPWDNHVDFGRMLGYLAYLMPILALIGRVGRPRIGHAFVVAILFIVQSILANVDTGWIAALHPLNGLLLLGAASSLGARMRELVQSDRGNTRIQTAP